jgi:hypothetical protein
MPQTRCGVIFSGDRPLVLTLQSIYQLEKGILLHRDQWPRTDQMRKEKNYVKRGERTHVAEQLMEFI